MPCTIRSLSISKRKYPKAEQDTFIHIQWSAVRVTAVTVTVGYSDSFGNPRFITNKTPLLTVTKNRLQWHLLPHFFRFLRHHMSKLTPEIDFLDNFALSNRFQSSYWSKIKERGLNFGSNWNDVIKALHWGLSFYCQLFTAFRVTVGYSDTFSDPRGCHCNRRPL